MSRFEPGNNRPVRRTDAVGGALALAAGFPA
jgi:hypothetical protein